MANKTTWTAKKREAFIAHLAKTGNITKSAKAAKVSRASAYTLKDSDPAFAEAWADAEKEYLHTLESEADRRAAKGTLKPVFYQGQKCGTVREYSDTLLMFRLKKLDPAGYRERSDVKHSGNIDHGVKFVAGLEEGDI